MGANKRSTDEDPLSRLLAPPANETPEDRDVRMRLEAEARQISDKIDEQLKLERAALKKNRPVKVLLLGQSESGESRPDPVARWPFNISYLSLFSREIDHAEKYVSLNLITEWAFLYLFFSTALRAKGGGLVGLKLV